MFRHEKIVHEWKKCRKHTSLSEVLGVRISFKQKFNKKYAYSTMLKKYIFKVIAILCFYFDVTCEVWNILVNQKFIDFFKIDDLPFNSDAARWPEQVLIG